MRDEYNKLYQNCKLCPRNCGIDRTKGEKGFCRADGSIEAARAALHFWEEPCISGEFGSGAVFFSGCNMGCVFCQNYEIAHAKVRRKISTKRLSDIFLELQDQNAANINLVTPTHFVPGIIEALEDSKKRGLKIPVVYNTGAYENVETIKLLDGLVDIYLPDCKYYSSKLSKKYSMAEDYYSKAILAIKEMVRQTGKPQFFGIHVHPQKATYKELQESLCADEYNNIVTGDECDNSDYYGPLMKRGTIVRHLLLPGNINDSIEIVRRLYGEFGNDIYISLMNQYTPMPHSFNIPELSKKVSKDDYERLIEYAIDLGVENAFIQGDETDNDSFIPAFDYTGI